MSTKNDYVLTQEVLEDMAEQVQRNFGVPTQIILDPHTAAAVFGYGEAWKNTVTALKIWAAYRNRQISVDDYNVMGEALRTFHKLGLDKPGKMAR